MFGIAGSNGSGKSTLLKLLAGIYQPDSGSIELSGPVTPLIEIGAGLQPELSGKDNLYLGASFIGLSRAETDAIYQEVVAFAGLEGEMNKKLKNYSSGMQVRLAFSLMTRGRGEIILVDEVLAVGDEDFQNKCWDYLKQIRKRGRTVVLVTHDMEALAKHCQRAILIDNQKIAAGGPAKEVAAAYHRLFAKPQKNKPMFQTIARSIFNLSKRYFNNLDRLLAGWEYQLTYRESNFRPKTGRLRLPALPEKINPTSKKDSLLDYDQAALGDKRLKVKDRFWSLGLRRRLIGWTRQGLFRLRLVGSRIYFKLIER